MISIRNVLSLCLASVLLFSACKGKQKPSLSGEDPIEAGDFLAFFPEKRPPFSISDSTVLKKETDSLLISNTIFKQFIPDSVLQAVFGKNVKPKFYPVARFKSDDGNYILAKGISNSKKAAILALFNKKDEYVHAMPLLIADANPATQQLTTIDRNFGIHLNLTRKNKDGTVSEGKDVHAYSAGSKKFMLIMTDAIDDAAAEIINPIDTLGKKFRYAGDYGTGDKNIISIRDGRRSDILSFFIHIDKSQGACTGELKGDAIIKSATTAEYRQAGDPCVLRFTFSSATITLKEMEGCGAHRTLRCSFDGSYPKKKAAKKKVGKK